MPSWAFLELTAASESELYDAYYQCYCDNYLWNADGSNIVHSDWRGTGVRFAPGKFEHAFSNSSDYKAHGGHDDGLSIERARRILWIRQVLAGDLSAGEIHLRRSASRLDVRGRSVVRQTYLVPSELYIVVLDQRLSGAAKGQWFFHTAYPTDASYFHDVAMKEGAHLDTRK